MKPTLLVLKIAQVALGVVCFGCLYKKGALESIILQEILVHPDKVHAAQRSMEAVKLISISFWMPSFLMLVAFLTCRQSTDLLSSSFFAILYHTVGALLHVGTGLSLLITWARYADDSTAAIIVSGVFALLAGIAHGIHAFLSLKLSRE